MPKSLALLVVLCACSGSAWAGNDVASAKQAGFWDGVLETLNLRTKVGPMPDFVQATHPDPAKLHYIPTGTPHPARPIAIETAEGVEATKQALDAARAAQFERAAAPAVAPPPLSLAPKRVAAKPKRTAVQN